MDKIDIRKKSHKELFLIVSNTEKWWLVNNNLNELTIKINKCFKYKNSQLKYLVNNI